MARKNLFANSCCAARNSKICSGDFRRHLVSPLTSDRRSECHPLVWNFTRRFTVFSLLICFATPADTLFNLLATTFYNRPQNVPATRSAYNIIKSFFWGAPHIACFSNKRPLPKSKKKKTESSDSASTKLHKKRVSHVSRPQKWAYTTSCRILQPIMVFVLGTKCVAHRSYAMGKKVQIAL